MALKPHEVEILRRSVAMLAPESPCGLTREQALEILGQLGDALRDESK